MVTTIKAFIMRHPVATYFALTFAISWGGVLMVLGPGGIPGTAEQVETLLPFAVLALLAGPSVAGVLMTDGVGRARAEAALRRPYDRAHRGPPVGSVALFRPCG
jgi:hypothetical protein